MTIDQLQEVWAAQHVTPNRADLSRLADQLRHEARQRSRRVLRIAGITTFVIVTGLATTLAAHLTGIRPFSAVTLATFLAGVVLNVGVLTFGARVHRRTKREYLAMGEAIADSLRVSAAAIDREIRDCVVAGYTVGVVTVAHIVTACVHYGTDYLPLRGLGANVALSLVLGLGIVATLRRYLRRKLLPRRDELRRERAAL